MNGLAGLPLWQGDNQDPPPRWLHSIDSPADDPSQPAAITDERPTRPGPVGTMIDWALIRALRTQAATELSTVSAGLDPSSEQEAGRQIVSDLLTEQAAQTMSAGLPAWSIEVQTVMAEAIMDALFRNGRFQRLMDNPQIENIEISGCDDVVVVYCDGRIERVEPVADTDEELIETLQFIATRSQSSPRLFSAAHPRLHMQLDGGARLAATAWVTPRPSAVIRMHRLVKVDLEDLVNRGTLDAAMAAFLGACVRAGKSIVVSGAQGSGKTTLVRALCAHLDPWERIGTLETERELHLRSTGRHHRLVEWEARPGSGERNPDGSMAGEVGLDDLVADSLRFNLSRLIVGEVRGGEIMAMFKAMQSGAGSMSTTHAHRGRAAIERLVTCALDAGPHVTQDYAYRQVSEHIDIIVQITLETSGTRERPVRCRFVSEILAVEPGENGRPATTAVWKRDPRTGRAVTGILPSHLAEELENHGFSRAQFEGVLQ